MNAIAEVRELLPWWVVWGPLLFTVPSVIAMSLLATLVAMAVTLRPLRHAKPGDWFDRARLGFPAARVMGVAVVLVPLVWILVAMMLLGPLCPVPRPVLVALIGVGTFTTTMLVARWVSGYLLQRRIPWATWLRGVFLLWSVFYSFLVVFVLVFASLPWQFDSRAWLILGIGGVAMLFFGTGSGLFLGQAIGVIRPASARLRAIVERACQRAGVPPVTVQEAATVQANAYAVPFLRRLVFTGPIAEIMTDDELDAICAHELAHLGEPRIVLIARLVPTLAMLLAAAGIPLMNALGVPGLLVAVMPFILSVILLPYLSRRMEKRADASAQQSEAQAGVYAQALLKLAQANGAPLVASSAGGSHPHTYDRLLAAGLQLDFPRPAPPPRWVGLVGLGILLVPVAIVVGLAMGSMFVRPTEPLLLAQTAAQGGSQYTFDNLGVFHARRGDLTGAGSLFRASGEAFPDSAYAVASLAIILAGQGRCDEAEQALREAERRARNHPSRANSAMIEQARQAIDACRQPGRLRPPM